MRAILPAIILLSFTCSVSAQSYLLSSFAAEKELSSKQITFIFQDSKGFIWIGTEDGLNMYNANSIKIFKHDPKNKNSIQNNYIQDICEDKQGNIWIGAANGVDCYTPATSTFKHFTVDAQNIRFGFKCAVFIDRNGTPWIGCDGLFRMNIKTQQFERIDNPYQDRFGLSHRTYNSIAGFFQDSKNRYWVGTTNGLFLYDDKKNIFTRFDIPVVDKNNKHTPVLFGNVYEDGDHELRVGTWGYGLYKIDVAEKKLIPFGEHNTVPLIYSSQQLNGKNLFWYWSSGLVSVDHENKILTRLQHKNDDPFSLRQDDMRALFTDKQGQLWIGYATQGIQIINPGNQLMKTYAISEEKYQISSISDIIKKGDHFYLCGWYNEPLCKLDSNFNVQQWWYRLPSAVNKLSNNASDIYFDKNENLWVTYFGGISSIDHLTGEVKGYSNSDPRSKNRFMKILPQGDSLLWLGGYNDGLTRFSLRSHQFKLYTPDAPELYWKVVADKQGNIWCAANNGYLDRFNIAAEKFTRFFFDTLTEKTTFWDIVYDSSANYLWAACTAGLVKINLTDNHAQLFTEKDGLPTVAVNVLCWDQRHRLWIGTNKGLSLYDAAKNSFRNFYSNNGLFTEKLDHCLYAGPDGKLYIGNDNCVTVADISLLEDTKEISSVYITNVAENQNQLQPKEKVIDLPYYKNNLSFEFAITDFINPEDNQLFYYLDGWDKNYIQTKKGSVSYNKLLPGKYVFHVRGINHNGIRNEAGDSVTIIIHPPFWKTWWFISLSALVLITGFVAAIRYISQRNLKEKLLLLEKEQAVEKERNRISRDMHDDLGSGLTKIAIMSEVVKKQINEPEKATQQLENISISSRELIDNLQDIIWILNPKNDTLESLAAYIREYALKFFEPFGIDTLFDYPEKFPAIRLSEETRRNIFLVIKETLNNTAKHAWCNRVKIAIGYVTGKINISIEDDGRGFNITECRQFGNGLINMKTRMEQVEGNYAISSAEGKGTKTELTL